MNQDSHQQGNQQLSSTSTDHDAVKTADSIPRLGRIVVGVDGSACSVDALRWAGHQAELTGATLDAVMSWEYPAQYGMEFGVIDVDWASNAETTLTLALHQAFGPNVEAINARIIRGRPAEVLMTAAAGADLLVVGSRGHGAMAGMLLGSVSDYLVAHAPCPVLVIRHVANLEQEIPQTLPQKGVRV
jgi:nucleotide-binding universal stress UspA family protein